MECSVCLERYDSAERRPKILPCGHSFCLKCLLKLPSQKCPLDNQMFESSPEGLVDNFSLLQATDKPIEIGSRRFWCLSCAKVATEECVDEHSVCSLKKARGGEAAPLLEALRRGEAVLAKLRHTLDDAVRGLANDDGRGALQREQAGLAAARQRLQSALEADAAVWEQAKRAAMQSDWNQSAAASDASIQLLTDLADPATKCTVTVRRGADGEASWTGEVRPAEDAAAALLLCRLACHRALQVARKPQEHTVVPAPRWRECSNELTVQEMASIMKWGSRVARGRDWEADWDFDGHPPEPGTVVEKCHGEVQVEWDHNGRCDWFNMGSEGLFHLRLLASVPLSPHLGTPGNYIDVEWFDLQAMTKLLSGTSLQKARSLTGLRCSVYPTWCKKVLGQVAPHLEGLQMVYPLQQHLDAALAMPHLQSLSITGVTGQQLRQVSFVASLRRLEIHCPPEDPLPLLSFSATKPGLRWLRSGVYPLVTALALMRAHADTLEELQLVAATAEPYGCPDLQREVRQCRLNKLKRLVLLRQTATDAMCRHRWNECKEQKEQLWKMFSECGLVVSVICSHCDKADFKN